MSSLLLRPFSVLYGIGTDLRNYRYNNSVKLAYHPNQFTIGVGNLTVGGTGKTPMVEYILRWLLSRTPAGLATLSRGYGRRTRGFRLATPTDTADTLGDEPLQLYRKFGPNVTVCVGEKRADALVRLAQERPDIHTVVLDDAFQHRAVQPHRNILLMDYNRPFYTDHPFPAGRLRERRHGARRADLIVVTKCPLTLSLAAREAITAWIRPYTRPETPVFFAGLAYGEPVCYADNQPTTLLPAVVLATGIAQAGPLEQYVRNQFGLVRHLRFGDHHAYTPADWTRIRQAAPPGTPVLTTEKDWVKLAPLLTPDERAATYYLPVELRFLDGADRFAEYLTVKNS